MEPRKLHRRFQHIVCHRLFRSQPARSLSSALVSCWSAKSGLVAASTPLTLSQEHHLPLRASLASAASIEKVTNQPGRRTLTWIQLVWRWACWVAPSPLWEAVASQGTAKDWGCRHGYVRVVSIAFQISSFIFPARICVWVVYTYRICGAPATLQLSYLTSAIDSHQSADRSTFTNKSVRMKGAYFTPAQQHLLNIFCLFRQILPPALTPSIWVVLCLKILTAQEGKWLQSKASWFYTQRSERLKWNSSHENGQYPPRHQH